MKAPMYLLNTTEVMTCRNVVETDHVKMLNDLLSYIGHIFKQNPLFSLIQDCVYQRKTLFYPTVLRGNNFH